MFRKIKGRQNPNNLTPFLIKDFGYEKEMLAS